jgi:hypothetical protein
MITDLILLRSNNLATCLDEYLKLVGNKYMNQVFSQVMDIADYFYPSIEHRENKKAKSTILKDG